MALARLLLARRPLVILDEPTEHLDGPTADALAETMATRWRGRPCSSSPTASSACEDVDRIVELQDGR